ncbi:hypothetical protein jhhlp_002258 [Lomentospora prolificans]|uniref:Uncharacterized protein n=1 Tax=Lomentospora prolificans TaxID=41688 RepID=A0A2N3NDG1_9PEZI|nr:hypothetical protein jhhlp_002258 [Lomentospora prolificans]
MFSPMDQPAVIDGRLLQGCFREAERCEIVSLSLEGLRNALVESFHAHMTALIEEIRTSGRILRDLADRSQVHFQRIPIVLHYLDVILPCLAKSLRDINEYIEDRTASKEIRWRKMYNKMTEESGGIPLPQRFVLYNHYLRLLHQLLTRDDPRSYGPRAQRALGRADLLSALTFEDSAEEPAKLPIPPDSTILFQRKFDNDSLALIAYINSANESPYLIMQTYHMGSQWVSVRGVHELCILRNHSAVELRRWSRTEGAAKLWASLYFITWEEMVLFYCSFASLKAQNSLTLEVDSDEYILQGERRLFQAQIIDDGFKHSLIVYEDSETKGMRLHAAVWEGELRQCPVWTAFITHQYNSPTWLVKKSRHRVWLKEIQLYVFCHRYRPHKQRKNREGAFELNFINEKAASKFRDLFYPPSSPTSNTDSENNGGPSR